MIVSVIFIIPTFIVFVSIPELHDLKIKCFLCYLACLATGFILFTWMQLNALHLNHMEPTTCKTVASLIYFSLLSAATWSNVISFDVWMCFR